MLRGAPAAADYCCVAMRQVPLRRMVLCALASGLSLAAVVSIVAILTHSFDQTDLRLVGTSLGFSVFSALGASGTRTQRRARAPLVLAKCTTAGAAVSFTLLVLAIWIDRGSDSWRAFGTVALATLAGSHACLVVSARRAADSGLVSALTYTSIATASIDSTMGVLAVVGAVKHVGSGYVRVLAVLVIVMLLTSLLPVILRRLAALPGQPLAGPTTTHGAPNPHPAAELFAIAARLERLGPRAGNAAKQLRADAAQLRQIADSFHN